MRKTFIATLLLTIMTLASCSDDDADRSYINGVWRLKQAYGYAIVCDTTMDSNSSGFLQEKNTNMICQDTILFYFKADGTFKIENQSWSRRNTIDKETYYKVKFGYTPLMVLENDNTCTSFTDAVFDVNTNSSCSQKYTVDDENNIWFHSTASNSERIMNIYTRMTVTHIEGNNLRITGYYKNNGNADNGIKTMTYILDKVAR